MRKNVAIFTAGVIGTGEHGQGIPAIVSCFRDLAEDNDLTVYSMLDAKADSIPRGIRLRTLPLRTRSYPLNAFLLGLLIVRDHLRRRYDLIHAIAVYPFGWVATVLGRLSGIRSLVVAHGGELMNMPEVQFGDLRNARRARKIGSACERADALVTLSRYQAAGLAAVDVSPERASIIPFGIDPGRFPFVAKRPAPPYIFVHVSYAQPVKDVETLLRTFERLLWRVEAKLLIVGQAHIGGKTEYLANKMQLADKVSLIGSVPNEKLQTYYHQAHFLLHTSRFESQGVVFNEAMASGVVVCSTRVGIAADLGEDYCVLAEVCDSDGLADEIVLTIGDDQRYSRLRENGLRWSRDHDSRWSADQYRRVYDGI